MMSSDEKFYVFSSNKTEVTICKNFNKKDNLEKIAKELCKKYDFINHLVSQHSKNNSDKLSCKISEYDERINALTSNIKLLISEINGTIIENGEICNSNNNFDLEYI